MIDENEMYPKRETINENSERKSQEEDQSSELASIGGYSNNQSLIVGSPTNEKSHPILREEQSSMLEESIEALQPQTEATVREKKSFSQKQTKNEKRASKKLTKQNKVKFKYDLKLAKMEKQ